MTKPKTTYRCQQCDTTYLQWQGYCRQCEGWNTLVEEPIQTDKNPVVTHYSGQVSEVVHLQDIAIQTQSRLATHLAEFDHVLGGGLVMGSVVLLGGDPGVGKSTLVLQVLATLGQQHKVLYVTGEESLSQVALRAKRLQIDAQSAFNLLAETQVEKILAVCQKYQPKIVVIDSIQTLFIEELNSAPGSVTQVRESAARLVRYAKQTDTALFIIGHVTKEGAIAGPRILEHMVDTVLYFEGRGDQRYRMIRAVKNRFGAVNELGLFVMTQQGLCQVSNPSAIFLSRTHKETAGSVVTVTWEGSRPLLVEVQSLVDESPLANPRRVCVGLDQNRLSMSLAVLHRHAGIATFNQDVFVNVVGGLRILETAADLAMVMAVLSSLKNKPLSRHLIVYGEVGLSGEIRPVPNGQARLREAKRHGFTHAIIPKANVDQSSKVSTSTLKVIGVQTLAQALTACWEIAE